MTLIDFLLEWTLRSAVLVVIVAIPALLWKRASAAQRHALWLSALIGIVLLPFLTNLPKWRLPSDPVDPAAMDQMLPLPTIAEVPVVAVEHESLVRASRTWTWNWLEAVLWLWILGVFCQLTRWVLGQWRLRRWLVEARPHPMEQHESFAVRCHRDLPGPLVTGLFRPTILLPDSAEGWEPARMNTVLAHELTHLQRHDLWSHSLGRWLLIAQWWNPLAHLAVRQMEQASESACDDRVLSGGVPAADYSMTLLEVAREASFNHGIPKCAVTMARTLPIEKPVERLLDVGQSRHPLGLLAVVGLSLASAFLAITVGTFTSQAQEPSFKLEMTPLQPDDVSGNLWEGLSAYPKDIKIISEGVGGTKIDEHSERVTFEHGTVSYKGFVVRAPEMELVRGRGVITITAKSAELSGPEQVVGSCGLLSWTISSGNTESIQLRDGVVMEMAREDGSMARRIESKDDTAYVDISFDGGAFKAFSPKGAMEVTLGKRLKEAPENPGGGFLGIIMMESVVLVDDIGVHAVKVNQVLGTSGAFNAGVERGDQIYAVDGVWLPKYNNDSNGPTLILGAFIEGLSSKPPGTVVTLDVMRGDKKMKFDVTLGRRTPSLR